LNRVDRRTFLELSAATLAAGVLPANEGVAAPAPAPLPTAAHTSRLTEGWQYSRGGLGGGWERRPNVRDSRAWESVQIPHCFNARDGVDPDTRYYQGAGCYRTLLKLDNPYPGGRTLLHFEGAGQKTEVYLFDEKLATHDTAYDELVVDVTEAALRYLRREDSKGMVPIVVVCDNSRDPETIPSSLADFVVAGGLFRYVNLVYVPAVSIERVHIGSTLGPAGAIVSVRARLHNPGKAQDALVVSLQVSDAKGAIVHHWTKTLPAWSGEQELGTFTLKSPALWSPAHPSLYRCTLTVSGPGGEHASVDRFGVRTFEFVKGAPFKLNGERLFLRGTHRHEDHAGLGSGIPEDVTRKEMALIKEMGVNFIRLGHYQQSRIVLDLCDELGILVWEEVPWCRASLPTERAKDRVRGALRAVIDQHQNHPAIIIWGLGNEVGWPEEAEDVDKEGIRAMVRELAALARELDPSRKTALRRTEFCADLVDVFAPSIWAGWYSGRYTEFKSSAEKLVKETPVHMFHAEWGGDSHAGRHAEDGDAVLAKLVAGQGTEEKGLDFLLSGGQARASKDGDWSETYICNLFDWHLKEQETMQDWYSGSAQWIFKDFATPHRPDNPVPLVNQKGVAERDLTLKESYYVFQSYWTEKPMVRIYAHSWPVRWGSKGEEKLVKVYSNCPAVELILNGVSCGPRKRNSQDFPAAGLRWLVRFADGENHLRAVGQKNGATVIDEIRFQYQTQTWGKPARLLLEAGRREGDVVAVQARAVDEQGVTCLDARSVVRFGLAGDGHLLADLGTASGSKRVELANGRALIRARIAGAAIASVSSPGLPTAFVEIKG
jgi:beta-galactosidase